MIKPGENSSTELNKVVLETNFPNLEINPTVVGATENDTKIEWVENTLKVLFELSWVEETVEDFIKKWNAVKATLEDWTEIYYSTVHNEKIDLIDKFLSEYYNRHYAYIRTPEWDLYWQIEIGWEWEMPTEKGILTMPMVRVAGKSVFFPVSAILSNEERELYEMYKQYGTDVSEKDAIEKQIMELMIKLSTLWQNVDIVDSNRFMKEITDLCSTVWTVKKLSLQNGKLIIDFAWRYGLDNSWNWASRIVLPPCQLTIDIPNRIVKGWACYHPHILGGHSLCMGWELSDRVNTFMRSKSLKWLVECMIQFGNSYTSEDCWLQNDDRAPAGCLKRYCYETSSIWENVDYTNLPVRFEDIMKTAIMYWNRPRESFWQNFRDSLRDYLMVGKGEEMIDIIRQKYGEDRVKQMLSYLNTWEVFRQKITELYWIDFNS